MRRNAFALGCFLAVALPGCQPWHTFQLETDAQPVQFGPPVPSVGLDTLDVVTGFAGGRFEAEWGRESSTSTTWTAGEGTARNVTVTNRGGESHRSDLDATIHQALRAGPRHFLADGRVTVYVRLDASDNGSGGWRVGPTSLGIRYSGILYRAAAAGNDEQ